LVADSRYSCYNLDTESVFILHCIKCLISAFKYVSLFSFDTILTASA
jgi:hypothetical protein